VVAPAPVSVSTPVAPPAPRSEAAPAVTPVAAPTPTPAAAPEGSSAPLDFLKRMFTGAPEPVAPPPEPVKAPVAEPAAEAPREAWFQRLRKGLARTGSGIAQVFTGARIDDELYEELESALLMADAGVRATEHLLKDLKQRVKAAGCTEPSQVKGLLADAIVDLLEPLERSLMVGEHQPTVIMVAGVNGAGKTTSIGKLTRHLAEARCKVLLAAADTFRAAAREQLEVWADRNQVEIVSQEGGDPASVTFDAVKAGKARGCDVVIADTAGRLPTQLHLMEELKKIKRVIGKADGTAPHEVLLVIDGNTGQNALEQVKSFDAALDLTGLIVTKLDGTAKGGVLAAIALWSRDRAAQTGKKVIPVYFIGVGEKLEDLQTFNAREFASALLN
jgi:fused signal recognition particle receptor